jgi:hypothetical protein
MMNEDRHGSGDGIFLERLRKTTKNLSRLLDSGLGTETPE